MTEQTPKKVSKNRKRKEKSKQQNLTPTGIIRLENNRIKNFALLGIFMSMFVSMLSATVVGTSMPVIMGDLGGSQTALTWVVTSTMLASAVAAPIWGKLADLTNKKLLMQLALTFFVVGSALAGLANSPEWLIGWRVLQGLGGGGLAALSQIIMADIINPRERGKYMGIGSAVMAVATIGGPLLGGFLTDTIGWRWNFYVAVPIAIITIIIMQLTLKLPVSKRAVKIDYFGAFLIATGFSSLLLWISLGGNEFEWVSPLSFGMLGYGILAIIALIIVESRVAEPMMPLTLFKNKTFTLASIASISVGISMFSVAVFLGQYLQLAKGHSPFQAGLLTIPMILGTVVSSTVAGQYVSKRGHWKRVLVIGGIVTLAGSWMMVSIRSNTPYEYLAVGMFLLGLGTGMTMQNLLLVVQNTIDPRDLGAASSNVTFFRTIGGTAGLAMMGAVISSEIVRGLKEGFARIGFDVANAPGGMVSDTIPVLSELPAPVRQVFEDAYGVAIANSFYVAVPFAVIAVITILMLPNIPLGTQTNIERMKTGGKGAAGSTPDTATDASTEDK